VSTDGPSAAIDTALFRLRRMWAKAVRARRTGGADRPVQMSNVLVVHAVHRLGPDVPEVTVGAVAEYLDIDPSTASRFVNDAIQSGFVERRPSQVDARRARLLLTELGTRVLEGIIRYRRAHLDEIMADWPEQDRETFARLLTRFADAMVQRPLDPDGFDLVVAEAVRGHRQVSTSTRARDRSGSG